MLYTCIACLPPPPLFYAHIPPPPPHYHQRQPHIQFYTKKIRSAAKVAINYLGGGRRGHCRISAWPPVSGVERTSGTTLQQTRSVLVVLHPAGTPLTHFCVRQVRSPSSRLSSATAGHRNQRISNLVVDEIMSKCYLWVYY